MRIHKAAYTIDRPKGAVILTRKTGKVARWKDRSGRQREAPLTKDGDRVRIETNCYSIAFEDHLRIKRTLKGYTDRGATQRLADFTQRLVNARRTCAPFSDELQTWINGLDDPTRKQFLDWGLLDPEQNELARPLSELISEYQASLEAKGRNAGHITDIIKCVSEAFEVCGFRFWRDIDAHKVEGYLRDLREGPRNLSYRRSNGRLQAAQSFCRWAVNRGWSTQSPLQSLGKLNPAEDSRHERRAVPVAQLKQLIDSTRNQPGRFGMSGAERSLLYAFTVETALRRGELQRLRKSDIDCDAGSVTIRAERATKNKRRRVQAIRPAMCAELRSFLATKTPDAKAWGGTYKQLTDKTARMLRQDLEASGLPYKDGEGRCFDFHSLRGETASLLAAAGANINDVKDVLRHSTIHLTADIYAKALEAGQKQKTIAALPNLLPETLTATGTDDVKILPESYSQGGETRTLAEASGSITVDSSKTTAIVACERGSSQFCKPGVVGSNPTVGFSPLPVTVDVMEQTMPMLCGFLQDAVNGDMRESLAHLPVEVLPSNSPGFIM